MTRMRRQRGKSRLAILKALDSDSESHRQSNVDKRSVTTGGRTPPPDGRRGSSGRECTRAIRPRCPGGQLRPSRSRPRPHASSHQPPHRCHRERCRPHAIRPQHPQSGPDRSRPPPALPRTRCPRGRRECPPGSAHNTRPTRRHHPDQRHGQFRPARAGAVAGALPGTTPGRSLRTLLHRPPRRPDARGARHRIPRDQQATRGVG